MTYIPEWQWRTFLPAPTDHVNGNPPPPPVLRCDACNQPVDTASARTIYDDGYDTTFMVCPACAHAVSWVDSVEQVKDNDVPALIAVGLAVVIIVVVVALVVVFGHG